MAGTKIIIEKGKVKKAVIKKEPLFKNASKGALAKITVAETATINVGNYESTKYTFGLVLPVTLNKIEGLRKEMEEYVTGVINKKVEKIKNELE